MAQFVPWMSVAAAPKRGMGVSLAWLVFAGVLPIIIFSAAMAWMFIDAQKTAAEAELAGMTRALRVAVDRELESQVTAMEVLASSPVLDKTDFAAFQDLARRVLVDHPKWVHVVLIDPKTHLMVAGPMPLPDPPQTTSAPREVDEVVASRKSLIVGALPRGKIIDRPMILMLTPVIRGGEVRFVMATVIDPTALSAIFAEQNLPETWTGAVIDARMRLAGRSRKPEDFVGRLATPSLVTHMGAANNGLFQALNQEGDKLYSVFSRSPVTGWSVVIGIPAADIDGPIRRAVIMIAAAGAGLVALALLLAFVVGRTIVANRRAAEDALRESEARYGRLSDLTFEGVIIHDGERILDVNRSFCRMFGYEAAELLGQTFDMLLTPDTLGVARTNVANKSEASYEVEGLRKDGSTFSAEITGRNVVFNGEAFRVACVRDVTERKIAEERLRESGERFRALVEGTTDWVWETDSDHRFVWFSDSFESVLGFPSATLIGRRRWDAASHDREIDAALWQAHIDDLAGHRPFRDFRYWIQAGEGRSRWISISGTPRFDDHGAFLGYRGSASDITAEASAALRLRMLSTVVDQSPVSVIITDPDSRIEYVNEHFSKVTGYVADEVIGCDTAMLASGETPQEVYAEMWGTILAGRRWAGELKNRRKNGQLHWEMTVISPIFDDEGRLAHFVAIQEDVTERRALEDQLRRTNEEMEQFAYVASHDLRQPLRMISSYLTLVQRKLGADLAEDVKEFLGYAVDGARRMDRLILDLLEYSRTGRHEAPSEPVDLNEVVAQAVTNLSVAINEAGASVTVAESLPSVLGHASELTRLFQNLIGNAIKYRPAGRAPVVKVGRRDEGRSWVLSVSDNGIGIAPGDRERVFGIFQRLVSREEYEGTGIGLSVCKKVVEHHGGSIWIESEPDQGTTFLIRLPKITEAPSTAR